jgi:hypothetical protein
VAHSVELQYHVSLFQFSIAVASNQCVSYNVNKSKISTEFSLVGCTPKLSGE